MKTNIQNIIAGVMLIFTGIIVFSSCKKEEAPRTDIATLTMVNAVVGGKAMNLSNFKSGVASNNNFSQVTLVSGATDINVWPTGDPDHPYFTYPKFIAKRDSAYSLFVHGVPGATEGIITNDRMPFIADSTVRFRFINLAPNSSNTPLNITLSTTPTMNEASLTYKQYTNFKSYPGLAKSAYTIQVRAASNPNTVLASLAFTATSLPRFSYNTIVVRQNGTGYSLFRVTNNN